MAILINRAGINPVTVACVGAISYAAVAVTHEAAGHGLACLAVGARVLAVSSTELRCDGVAGTASTIVTAAGSAANVLVGVAVLGSSIRRPPRSPILVYFVWLFGALSLFHAGSYLLVGALFGFGDWDRIAAAIGSGWYGAILVGAVGSGLVIGTRRLASHGAWQPLIGDGEERAVRWRLLTWPALIAAAVVSIGAGLLSPLQPQYALVSSIAGPLVLLWLVNLPRWPQRGQPVPGVPIARSLGWWAAGLAVSAAFVLLLGPGLGTWAGYSIVR